VTVLPGPSAVVTALVASGLAADQYRFVGYLPRRRAELEALWGELAGWPHATVAFESPRRLPATLASLAAADPERDVAVCRELTKVFEEVVRGSAATVAARFAEPPRGEITIVIGAAPPSPDDLQGSVEAVAELVAAGAARGVAATVVSRLTGAPRNALYRDSL
jgi:16S rRNA (cytidine1402-2'-O)-methyltransferase